MKFLIDMRQAVKLTLSRWIFGGFLVFVLPFSATKAFGQAELQKIKPLSPNAAAIAKYGETPVGYFTGVPNISIPLFNLAGHDLQLPLSLSYHAGGNKVEDMASWVGLGWSLGSIPCISRTTRGLEDEGPDGFFNLYHGKTIKELYDNQSSSDWTSFLEDLRSGVVDPEPDIFSYSLPNKSGKFFFNQETQKFYTIPFDNIKIEKITSGFRITSDDGTKYEFTRAEVSMQNLQQTTNSWWATKITNANETDEITIDYAIPIETFTTQASISKSIYISGQIDCNPETFSLSSVTSVVSSIKPYEIHFSKGSVKFVPQTTERQDLPGSYALDRIELYDYNNVLIKAFKFLYTTADGGCGTDLCKRLLLTGVREQNAAGNFLPPHTFTYDLSRGVPSRLSPAQDYWGFYNAATTNQDLVPSIFHQYPGDTRYRKLPGADRLVNDGPNQFLILNQITYPTGGHTDFYYESNVVSNIELPTKTIHHQEALTGNGTGQGSHATFTRTFTINVPADPYLNANTEGTYADVKIGNLGCDISGGANLCANLTISSTNPDFSTVSFISNVDGFYLPNGTYTMTAEFYQDDPQYGNFFFDMQWEVPDQSFGPKRYAGGLRIKEMRTYDEVNNAIPMVKKFRYTTCIADSSSVETDSSSGLVFGIPYFNYQEDYVFKRYKPSPANSQVCIECVVNMLRRSSYSNITAVSHSGSYVGYKEVTVWNGAYAENGKTVFKFSQTPDAVVTSFPYAPAQSHETSRGLLTAQIDYKKTSGGFARVKAVTNTYESGSNTTMVSSLTGAIKASIKDVYVTECNQNARPPQVLAFYDIKSDWMQMTQASEKTYSSSDPAQSMIMVTDYEYDPIGLQVSKVKTYSSTNQEITAVKKYPYDLTLTGTAEAARLILVSQNRLNVPLQQINSKAGVQKKMVMTNFKEIGTGKAYPDKIDVKLESYESEPRVQFNAYDSKGNLQEQQKVSDIKFSYLYDYHDNYPIAEVTNADVNSIAYTSFEADGTGNWQGIIPGSVQSGIAITGVKSYNATGFQLYKAGLSSAAKYTVTYWSKNGAYTISGTEAGYPKQIRGITLNNSQWTLYEHLVSGQTQITVQGSGTIDELRLYPAGSLMSSYCHIPLVGLSAECDANNRILRYTYDSFGRLTIVRDEEDHILKKNAYNIYGQ